jgi:SAM-dependent methyltransferase
MHVSAAIQDVERELSIWSSDPEVDVDRWDQLCGAQSHELVRRALKRLALRLMNQHTLRGQPEILSQYDRQWRKKTWEKYRPTASRGGGPWIWGARKLLLSNEAGAALRLLYLDAAIAALRPRSVLEVGCGNGINLALLAARYPDIEFCGIEPTPHGLAMAQGIAEDGSLPDSLRDFAPFDLLDERAVSRIRFIKASGGQLPFSDSRFDVVLTSLALEQMEALREAALKEIARVARLHTVMLEPFSEANSTGLRRRYVRGYDYFQGAIADLPRYGLEPVSVVSDMPHKAWLGTAFVVAQKSSTRP